MSKTGITNNDIFQEFWNSYQWPEDRPEIYRLYHDDQGRPLEYSREEHPGLWIPLTLEQYAKSDFRVRVVNGKLMSVPRDTLQRLRPGVNGTPCHPRDVAIVTARDQPHQNWSIVDETTN